MGGIKASRFGSVGIRILFALLMPATLFVTVYGSWDCWRHGQRLVACFQAGLFVVWFLLMELALRDGPLVYLTEEGVWVRVWLRKRFYPWTQILQAGILYRPNYRGDRNWPCLLLPGGSKLREQDRYFHLRNYGRVVWIHNSPEVLEFVKAHYGALDFDLSRKPDEWGRIV